jgi:gluconokinase
VPTNPGEPPERAAGQVVIGVDIGTTSTKAVAVTRDGHVLASGGAGYPLLEPHPGHAVQDPDEIVGAVLASLRTVVADLDGTAVAGLSFSAAMHSLMGLSPGHDLPVTPLVTWADTRATEQAQRLRAAPGGLALHQRTGTPLHPMSPLPKLLWFREQEPKLFERVGHWVGIKEYVLLRLCGALVVDHSVASAMGLMNLAKLAWDDEALQHAGIEPEQLAELVPTTFVLPELTEDAAARTGLPVATPVVVGASDGPLANLGLGAVEPGVAACSIGTSGALRVTVDRPAVDPLGRVFCYALAEDRWVVGGAINNGGVVLEWAGDALAPDLGAHSQEELLELAASVPAGSAGLLMLPYLLSERAPQWSALPQGAYVGLSRAHRRGHLVRAALEGVCLQLSLVLQSMRAAGLEVRELRATGGFARSPLWKQMLADALGMPISFPEGHEGSSFGAAMLGMQALGLVPSIDVAADLVQVESTVRPDASAAATYAALQPVFAELYHALVPTFTSLRRLAPGLPVDHPTP